MRGAPEIQAILPAIPLETLVSNWKCATSCSSSKLGVREEMRELPQQALVQNTEQESRLCILGLTLVSTADFCAPPFNYVFSWSTRAKNMPTSCKRPAHTFTDASFKCLSFKNRFFWLISHQNIHMHVTDVHLCVTHNLFSWPTVLNTIWICKPSQDLCSLQIWKTYRLGTTGLSELFQPFIL